MASFVELKQKYTIDQVARVLQLSLTPKISNGINQLRGRCPVHGREGSRELVITPSRVNADGSVGAFYCWCTKTGGDLVQLVVHIRDCDHRTAGEFIEQNRGTVRTVPAASGTVPTVPQGRDGTEKDPEKILQPLPYLEPGHETVAKLGIGEDLARTLALGYAPKGTMRGRVLVPCHDRGGVLRAYCGIAPAPETSPRFLFPSNFSPDMHIWNAHRVTEGDLFACRDVLEALGAMQNGVENVVSFLAPITAQSLEMLSSLMDEKKIEHLELF
jgi:hypothetical protein